MIILGIDPAIRTTGYGVIRTESVSRFEILDCGIIANSARLPHTECLRRLAGGIRELVGAFTPDYASIEDPFVGKNASTAIILGMARAFGEALAVQMVIGNAATIPDSLVSPAATLTSVLTTSMGNEAMGTVYNDVLWSLALILLLMSLVFILIVHIIGNRSEVKHG